MFNDVDNEFNAVAVASFARLELSPDVLFFAAPASRLISFNVSVMPLILSLIAIETDFVISFVILFVVCLRPSAALLILLIALSNPVTLASCAFFAA